MLQHYLATNQRYERIILIDSGNSLISFIRSDGSLPWHYLRSHSIKFLEDLAVIWRRLHHVMRGHKVKSTGSASNCKQGKPTGGWTQKNSIYNQIFGWKARFELSNEGTILGIFRFGVLTVRVGLLLLIFIWLTETSPRALFTAENVDRIGLHQSILSIGFSARIAKVINFVIVRI